MNLLELVSEIISNLESLEHVTVEQVDEWLDEITYHISTDTGDFHITVREARGNEPA